MKTFSITPVAPVVFLLGSTGSGPHLAECPSSGSRLFLCPAKCSACPVSPSVSTLPSGFVGIAAPWTQAA